MKQFDWISDLSLSTLHHHLVRWCKSIGSLLTVSGVWFQMISRLNVQWKPNSFVKTFYILTRNSTISCSHETLHELLAMKYIFNNRYFIMSRLNVQWKIQLVLFVLFTFWHGKYKPWLGNGQQDFKISKHFTHFF